MLNLPLNQLLGQHQMLTLVNSVPKDRCVIATSSTCRGREQAPSQTRIDKAALDQACLVQQLALWRQPAEAAAVHWQLSSAAAAASVMQPTAI